MFTLDVVRRNRAALVDQRKVLVAKMEQVTHRVDERGGRQSRADADEFRALERDVNALDGQLLEFDERIAELEESEQRADAASDVPFSASSSLTGAGGGAARSSVRSAALRSVESTAGIVGDSNVQAAVRSIEADPSDDIAGVAAVSGSPEYLRAFAKWVRDPMAGPMEWTDQERQAWARARDLQRAMNVGTPSAGGYMVPFTLDPSIIITGAGNIDPLRRIATVKQTSAGSWHGVTAGQVSAEWKAELAAASDATPTLTQPTIPVHLEDAFIPASFEQFADVSDLAAEVTSLLTDAKANLEAAAFATGSGSGQPKGIVTAVTAVAGSRVAPATAATYVLSDVYGVQNALPARFSPKASWLASLTILNLTRRFGEGSTGSNSAFWADLGGGIPPELLGRSIYESSGMSSTIAANQNVLLYGDMSKYFIIDHVGGTTLEFIPNLVDPSTGRPIGARGFMLWSRTGADVVDANAFRVLKL